MIKKGKILNFARRNFFEKKEQENKKTEREKKKGEGSLKTFYVKIKLMIRAGRSVGSAESKDISVLNTPAERETRVS